MGLLDDFLNNDSTRMGIGLLAAGGARTDGAGFGQRMQEAMSGIDAYKQKQLQEKLFQLQLQEHQAGIAQKQLQMENMKRGMAMLDGSPAQPQIWQLGSGTFGIMPTQGDAPAIPTANKRSIADFTPNEVELYERLTGGKITDLWQAANKGFERQPGTQYKLPGGGMEMGPPKLDSNIQAIPNGRGGWSAGAVPGVVDAVGQLEGAKARATEGAKAELDPFTFTPAGGGNPVLTTRSKVVQQTQPDVESSGYAGGSRNAANAEAIRMMQAELKKPTNTPEDNAAIQREIARLQKQSGFDGIRLQSDAERAKAVGTANADVVRDTSQQKSAQMYGQMNAGINRALELLKAGPTASGIGSLVDKTAGFFGKSTNGADLSSQLKTLSGWLTSNVPRMEGPQSDRDVINYKIMAGDIGDETKPISQRIKSANELKLLQDKYAHLNGYAQEAAPEPTKSFKDYGYKSQADVIKDAQNTIMKNPKAKGEVMKRLAEMGVSMGTKGTTGAW